MSRLTLEHALAAGAVGAVAFFLATGRDSAPSLAIETVDPSYQVTRDSFAAMGDILRLQGECLDDNLNRQQTDTPACLDLAQLKAALATDAMIEGGTTGLPEAATGTMVLTEGAP